MNVTTTAHVSIERPARYGKQLVSHMSRKFGGEWSAEQGSGWLLLGEHRVEVAAGDDVLDFTLTGPEEGAEQMQEAVSRHLVRFAADQQLDITWKRH